MPKKKQCIAMLLAGGAGTRLGILTSHMAKPAVPFGGKYRIIDFALSNCANSEIDVVGVLTQYQPMQLNAYIGSGQPWDLDRTNGGVFVLPPYVRGKAGQWYAGSANAIYQNIEFIEQYDPEYVLVLAGDHIYTMDYSEMLSSHIETGATATIAVTEVPWEEAPRFGIMSVDETKHITQFYEKPAEPKSNLASMGVYIFSWPILREYLETDNADERSSKDFGKDIIPKMLADKIELFAYPYTGYWKDVGTIESLWEAHMDLLMDPPAFDLNNKRWRIYSRNPGMPPHYVYPGAEITRSMVTEGCVVQGKVRHSVLFAGVQIEEGATVEDSIIMPGAVIKANAKIRRAVIAEKATVGRDCVVGGNFDIAVVGGGTTVPDGAVVECGMQVDPGSYAKGSE